MFIKFAWKNIWRNKKRTIIVSASVFFAVILAVVMRSGQLGSYGYMIHSSAKMQTGYLQIQGKGFWENRSLDKSMKLSPGFLDTLSRQQNITSITPRLETFALLSHDTVTKVAAIIGIDLIKEQAMTDLKGKLVSGKFLSKNNPGILLAEGLAQRMKIGVGDSLILYGSGYHGHIAAAELNVTGIAKFALPKLNKMLAFIELNDAQYIYAAPDLITSLSVMINNVSNLPEIYENIDNLIDEEKVIMTWDEMMPELKQNIQIDNASGLIMIGILYMVIAFGIFGTIMMMTAEREKEFGILNSLGMKKSIMMLVSVLESIMVSFIGVIIGIIISIPITYYLKKNPIVLSGDFAKAWEMFGIDPIMPFSVDPNIYFWQSIIVFVIALICAIYPLLFISKLNIIKAFRK